MLKKAEQSYKEEIIHSIPSQVSSDELNPNGMLLSSDIVNAIKALVESEKLTLLIDGKTKRYSDRITKKQLNAMNIPSKYSVIISQDEKNQLKIYAIYKGKKYGKHLGAGEYGGVKLIQDQETGEFLSFKTQPAEDEAERQRIEEQCLQKMGLLQARVQYEPQTGHGKIKYGSRANAFIMKLATGSTVENLMAQNMTLTQRMQMIADISKELYAVHKNRILHADVKPQNIIYDLTNRKAMVIDYGSALLMDNEGKAMSDFRGTTIFMEPHLRQIFFEYTTAENDPVKQNQILSQMIKYTEETDVYALGITIARILDLAIPITPKKNEKDVPYFKLASVIESEGNQFFPDPDDRQIIIDYLKKMTDPSPDARPTAFQAYDFFQEIQKQLQRRPNNSVDTALIDVKQYRNSNEQEKKAMLEKLFAFDQVQLICSTTEINIKDIQFVKKEMEEHGLSVKESIIYGDEVPANLIIEIQKKSQISPITHRYSFVTQQKITEHQRLTEWGIPIIMLNRIGSLSEQKPQKMSIPYLPSQVNPDDLGRNGKLLSGKLIYDIQKLIATSLTNIKNGKLSKHELQDAGINSKYSIFFEKKDNNEIAIYAVYQGAKHKKAISSSHRGETKFVQDLTTGEFLKLKTKRESLSNEAEKLKQLGIPSSHFIYTPQTVVGEAKYKATPKSKDKSNANAIITTFNQGVPLSDLNQKNLSTVNLLQMAIDTTRALEHLHQNKLIHRAIEPNNIIYDPTTRQANLINFNYATDVENNSDKDTGEADGALAYAPPEVRNTVKNPTLRALVKDSPNRDIYNLGITLAKVFGLTKEIRLRNNVLEQYALITESSKAFQDNQIIADIKVRSEILQFLNRMTDRIPGRRPSLTETIKFFENKEQQLNSQLKAPSEVGLLNIKEYNQCNQFEKEQLIKKLSNFDQVMLIVPEQNANLSQIQQLKRSLEKQGIVVKNELLYGTTSIGDLIKTAKDKLPTGVSISETLPNPQRTAGEKVAMTTSVQTVGMFAPKTPIKKISIGQALLLLLDKYKMDRQKSLELKQLYLTGIVDPAAQRLLENYKKDVLLNSYFISDDPQVINDDPTRRYFESHLALETLKATIQKIDYGDIETHAKFIYQLSPETEYSDIQKKVLAGIFDKNQYQYKPGMKEMIDLTNAEFADAINSITHSNLYKDFSKQDKDKLILLLKSIYLGVINCQLHDDDFPLPVYGMGPFSPSERGRDFKEVSQINVTSTAAGLMKSTMPLPAHDNLMRNEAYPYQKPADRNIFDEEAKYVKNLFGTGVNIFSSSISGSFLSQLRVLKELDNKGKLQFEDLEKMKTFIACFISCLLFNSGGHGIYEFLSVLNIPEIKNEFNQHIHNFDSINANSLFLEDNEHAFDEALKRAIEYNNTLLKRTSVHEELTQVVPFKKAEP